MNMIAMNRMEDRATLRSDPPRDKAADGASKDALRVLAATSVSARTGSLPMVFLDGFGFRGCAVEHPYQSSPRAL